MLARSQKLCAQYCRIPYESLQGHWTLELPQTRSAQGLDRGHALADRHRDRIDFVSFFRQHQQDFISGVAFYSRARPSFIRSLARLHPQNGTRFRLRPALHSAIPSVEKYRAHSRRSDLDSSLGKRCTGRDGSGGESRRMAPDVFAFENWTLAGCGSRHKCWNCSSAFTVSSRSPLGSSSDFPFLLFLA